MPKMPYLTPMPSDTSHVKYRYGNMGVKMSVRNADHCHKTPYIWQRNGIIFGANSYKNFWNFETPQTHMHYVLFLASTSSTRSYIVNQFVCSSVPIFKNFLYLLVSLDPELFATKMFCSSRSDIVTQFICSSVRTLILKFY